jgi:hypothetical protein
VNSGEEEMKLEKWKTITEIAGIGVAVMGSLIGGVFAGYQYLEQVKANRVKETLTFVARFQEPAIGESWKRITNVWLKHEKRMYALLDDPKLSTDKWIRFVHNVVINEKIETDVFAIADFLGSIQICVRSEVCDSKTAKAFFGSDARSFFRLHYSVFDAIRESRGDPLFAKEIEDFVRSLPRQQL